MRIAIAGAGVAGLTAAWLLEQEHDVVVFEAAPRPGGNARAAEVEVDGRVLRLDLGAQHISPAVYPHHFRLLRQLGLADELLPAPQSFTLTVAGEQEPLLMTAHEMTAHTWPRAAPTSGPAAEALAAYVARGVELARHDASWELPLADLVETLPVTPRLREQLLYARAAAMTGVSVAEARELSARAATALLARTHAAQAAGAEGQLWFNVAGSLGALVDALAADLRRATVHTGRAVRAVRTGADGVELEDDGGGRHAADRVVLAVPPGVAARLLAPVAGSERLRAALDSFRVSEVTVALHREPAFMPPRRELWSTYDMVVHDGWCEIASWFHPIHGVELFKTWISHRDLGDVEPLATARMPLLALTPAGVRAQRLVATRQGERGIHFAGHHLRDIGSQESAVLSAIDVARALAPEAPRLARLLG